MNITTAIQNPVQHWRDQRSRIHSDWNSYDLKKKYRYYKRHRRLVDNMFENMNLTPCLACLSVVYSNSPVSNCPDCGCGL